MRHAPNNDAIQGRTATHRRDLLPNLYGAQVTEGTSLASQEALCRAHAAARGDAYEPVRPLTISQPPADDT